MNDDSARQRKNADKEVRKKLPAGVKLVRTLSGHRAGIARIAWSSDGQLIASPSWDGEIRLWDANTGKCVHALKGDNGAVRCVAFNPANKTLASGGTNDPAKFLDPLSGELQTTLQLSSDDRMVNAIAFDPTGSILASGHDHKLILWDLKGSKQPAIKKEFNDLKYNSSLAVNPIGSVMAITSENNVILLDPINGQILHSFNNMGRGISCAFDPTGSILAVGSTNAALNLWDMASCKLLRILEGHTCSVRAISFLSNGQLLASQQGISSDYNSIRLWRVDTGECIATIDGGTASGDLTGGMAIHPFLPIIAAVGTDPEEPDRRDQVIHIFELDPAVLLEHVAFKSITYASAKIVLVGDSGVGKTGLGWRLAYGYFRDHSSTHGQQFWMLKQLCKQRIDGTQCEAVLWDLAGQPDYRLIHALYLNDADLALLLFDPTHKDEQLSGVEFWLNQLKVKADPPSGTPTILIAARTDCGAPWLQKKELETFCKQHGIKSYLATSAKNDEGIDELIQQMQELIPWDTKPATITTETFKRIKDFVLGLKGDSRRVKVILTPEELRQQLENSNGEWKFSDAEMLTAVGHLATHGYVTQLKTSKGEPRILIAPELLNNLAASFVQEARRNPKGLGSLEEKLLLSGGYKFPELEKLTQIEKDTLVDSAVVLFLQHNICFREADPLNDRTYLVFPELINLVKPEIGDQTATEDSVSYTISGPIENVYASLVVLMGYTQTFTRTNQWRNHARYEVATGDVCGFYQEAERAGELDFVLYFGTNTSSPMRGIFQGLFEEFLTRRNLTLQRFEPVVCSKGHTLNRMIVREQMSEGSEFAFCSRCGERMTLPKADQPIQLTKQQTKEMDANRNNADRRSIFEQALYRLKNYVTEQKIAVPNCFISYAWGDPEQESWVEKSLAMDLQKAGITVILDRWENARIGASVPKFVERVGKTDYVIVVGTPRYLEKYEHNDPMSGFIVAAEADLIGARMIGTEEEKESILPVLLEDTAEKSFPGLLQGRVYADFRKKESYFKASFELLLTLYQIPHQDPVANELRDSLMRRYRDMTSL